MACKRRQRQLADSNGPCEWVLSDSLHELVLAENDSTLRSTQQFVAAAEHDIRSGGEALLKRWLGGESELCDVDQGSAADVVDCDHAVFSGERYEVIDGRCLAETDHAKVRRMHVHDRRCVGGERLLVVADMRAVRCADFPQHRTAEREDLRQSKRTANLNQLPARDDYFASRTKRRGVSSVAAALLLTISTSSQPVSERNVASNWCPR